MADRAIEELVCQGYAIAPSGLPQDEIAAIAQAFDQLHADYTARHGHDWLKNLDEHHTIRLPLAYDARFLDLAANRTVMEIVGRLIGGKFILNQQNGIVNPAGERYNQGAWHRDLPYQHFVSSRPLAINALYCVDDFTIENGATFVLPGSHKQEAYPSDAYIEKHAAQISAPAGSFVIVDCMTYHRGGFNRSPNKRRAVNHVYTIPLLRQQIDIPAAVGERYADSATHELLGFRYPLARSIEEYLASRKK
ncbi:MAG: phytanoyl-CoA dioxygenase family protein [Proteobacteria bacterium]|nr:phytanoyl-CoA dioxygenase family protein [Pseudomonadota bacterium]